MARILRKDSVFWQGTDYTDNCSIFRIYTSGISSVLYAFRV